MHSIEPNTDARRVVVLKERLQFVMETKRRLTLEVQELLLLRRGAHFVRPTLQRRRSVRSEGVDHFGLKLVSAMRQPLGDGR